jgi:hypothetical protein
MMPSQYQAITGQGGAPEPAPAQTPAAVPPQGDLVGQLYDAIDAIAMQMSVPTEQLIMELAKKSVGQAAPATPAPVARPTPAMFSNPAGGNPYADFRG